MVLKSSVPLSCRPVFPLILSAHPRRSKFLSNVNVEMTTCYSLISDSISGHSSPPPPPPTKKIIARLLNSFPYLYELLSCFLCALRWVVSGARKSFPGHLHWSFTYDQLGDRRISDVDMRKILPCLLRKTYVIYVTVGRFINRSQRTL